MKRFAFVFPHALCGCTHQNTSLYAEFFQNNPAVKPQVLQKNRFENNDQNPKAYDEKPKRTLTDSVLP